MRLAFRLRLLEGGPVLEISYIWRTKVKNLFSNGICEECAFKLIVFARTRVSGVSNNRFAAAIAVATVRLDSGE